MKHNFYVLGYVIFLGSTTVIVSCAKDEVKAPAEEELLIDTDPSFTEEFDSVGTLASRGWLFRNNIEPLGQTWWRQGRYEAANQAKSTTVGPYLGFPAYSGNNTPNDFVSCLTNLDGAGGNISAWFI